MNIKKPFQISMKRFFLIDNRCNYSVDSSDAKDESNPPASK